VNAQRGVVSALWFLFLVNYLDRVALSFAGPSIMKSLHMTPTDFGVVLGSFGIGYLLAQLPGGLLADRIGARAMLVISPLLWAVFTGLTGLATTIAVFVAVRICFGFSEGLSNTSAYKVVGEHFAPKGRARAVALNNTAIPLAPLFAGILVGKLVGAYGWQMMFFLMTIPAVLAALVTFSLIPGKPTYVAKPGELPAGENATLGQLFAMPSLRILCLACFAWNIPYWGFLGWMPSYLALARHIDLKSVGMLAAVPYLFAFLGMVIVGWLGSTVLHRRCSELIAICFLGGAGGLYFAFQAETLTYCLVGLSITAFFLFATLGPVGKTALDLAPERRRAAFVGIYNSVGQVGSIVAPPIIGFLVTKTGTFATGIGFMIGASIVAALCFIALAKYTRQATAPIAAPLVA
jgi:MFS family permease